MLWTILAGLKLKGEVCVSGHERRVESRGLVPGCWPDGRDGVNSNSRSGGGNEIRAMFEFTSSTKLVE